MQKIERYLLERFPTLWNTKLVWVLAITLPIHILHFLYGFLTPLNSEENSHFDIMGHYGTGLFFIHAILSIILTVIWLTQLFQNNAFKSFYPSSNWKLFSQFVQYVAVIYCNISFFITYVIGLKCNALKYAHTNINSESQLGQSLSEISNFHLYNAILWYLVVAYVISILIFCFRITGLKEVLFTIVFNGVISLAMGLISLLLSFILNEYTSMLWIFINTIILLISIFRLNRVPKLYSAIAINYILSTFIYTLILIFNICLGNDAKYNQPTLYLITGFIFVYLYCEVIHQWKAILE